MYSILYNTYLHTYTKVWVIILLNRSQNQLGLENTHEPAKCVMWAIGHQNGRDFVSWPVKGTIAWDLFVPVFRTDQTYIGQIISFWVFTILFLNLLSYSNFLTLSGDSVDAESHSLSTESMPSETPCQLSQHRVKLCINWVNAELWNLHKCWCLLGQLSWSRVSLRIDSVDMESHSALTQLAGSLTPHWLSVRKRNQTKTGLHTQLWRL